MAAGKVGRCNACGKAGRTLDVDGECEECSKELSDLQHSAYVRAKRLRAQGKRIECALSRAEHADPAIDHAFR